MSKVSQREKVFRYSTSSSVGLWSRGLWVLWWYFVMCLPDTVNLSSICLQSHPLEQLLECCCKRQMINTLIADGGGEEVYRRARRGQGRPCLLPGVSSRLEI